MKLVLYEFNLCEAVRLNSKCQHLQMVWLPLCNLLFPSLSLSAFVFHP